MDCICTAELVASCKNIRSRATQPHRFTSRFLDIIPNIFQMRTRAPPYEYNALAGPRNIRILILQPARDFSHPIKCVFDEVTLTDTLSKKQQYEALSYTWGSPTGTQPILCDDATVLVTPNCEHAILYLRRKFTPRRLWIDAICINQASIQEKNQQVPMMGDIYSYAACSIMWLGLEGDPRLSGVLRRAARYGDAANVLGGVMRKAKNNLKRVGGYGESYADNTIDSTWQANVICEKRVLPTRSVVMLANPT